MTELVEISQKEAGLELAEAEDSFDDSYGDMDAIEGIELILTIKINLFQV